MKKLSMKKTLNLHKYSLRVNNLVLNWKLILPIIFTLAGFTVGSFLAKGERALYLRACDYIKLFILADHEQDAYAELFVYLLIPSIFALILFFCGMSAFGGWFCNLIPFVFSIVISTITYFIYNNYALKGLAYNVIMIFPYAIISLLSLILLSAESISMSQCIMHTLNKSTRTKDYNFVKYCKNGIKYYILIIVASLIKFLIDSMFADLFVF